MSNFGKKVKNEVSIIHEFLLIDKLFCGQKNFRKIRECPIQMKQCAVCLIKKKDKKTQQIIWPADGFVLMTLLFTQKKVEEEIIE